MENKSQINFWKKSGDDSYYVSKPFTNEDLKNIENKLGYKIPSSYKSLLSTRNGGLLKRSFFPLKDILGKTIKVLQCDLLYGIADNDQSCILGKYNNKQHKNGKNLGTYDFVMDGFQIGEWSPNSGWGNTYFYFDYSLCGNDEEPQVCAYQMKWSSKHNMARPINHIIASNFSEFIDNLTTKPKVEPFDFDIFKPRLIDGIKKTMNELLKEYSFDEISAFGLYTDDGSFISTSIDTVKNREINDKFLTSEWTLEGTNDSDIFSELTNSLENYVALLVTESKTNTFRNKLIDCCTSALLKLKEDGYFFEKLGKEITLMVGTSHGDLAIARFNKVKKTLNPK